MQNRFCGLFAAAALGLFLAGCSPSPPTGSDTSASPPKTVQQGGNVKGEILEAPPPPKKQK